MDDDNNRIHCCSHPRSAKYFFQMLHAVSSSALRPKEHRPRQSPAKVTHSRHPAAPVFDRTAQNHDPQKRHAPAEIPDYKTQFFYVPQSTDTECEAGSEHPLRSQYVPAYKPHFGCFANICTEPPADHILPAVLHKRADAHPAAVHF